MVHLWTAILLLLVWSVSRLLAFWLHADFLHPHSGWISNVISLAVVVLLWRAYSRWCRTIQRRRELEFVIQGIGPDMIMVIGPDRRIRMCNDSVEGMFGYTPEEVLGQTTDLLYFDRRITGERHEVYNRLRRIGFHTGFAKGRRKNGSVLPLEIVTGDLPEEPGAVILIRDITERKQAEDQLIQAKETTERANAALKEMVQMRDSLTNMIVHDLKSPLTAIAGYLELIGRYSAARLDERDTGFLKEALRLTNKMAEMINTMLDLRRLESKEMPLQRESCDLKELAEEALRLIGPEAACTGIDVHIQPEGLPAFCDRRVICRVLVNLLGNAVKFTPQGGSIRIAFTRSDSTVKVTVSDSGSGIPPEYHEKIFESFTQVEARGSSTGLGLAFCKLAVEAHNGRIGVESQVSKGSTFWFTLPVGETARNPGGR
jgi:PAS domain S-box-containing protein